MKDHSKVLALGATAFLAVTLFVAFLQHAYRP